MVAVSGACSLVSPAEAAAIGLVAGILVPFSVELLDRLGVRRSERRDLGTRSGRIVGGNRHRSVSHRARPKQWLAQMAMLAALLGFVLPLTYGLNLLLNRVYPQRIHEGRRAAGTGYVRTWVEAHIRELTPSHAGLSVPLEASMRRRPQFGPSNSGSSRKGALRMGKLNALPHQVQCFGGYEACPQSRKRFLNWRLPRCAFRDRPADVHRIPPGCRFTRGRRLAIRDRR